jgi:S-ribosylhomocysteine lyase
MDKIPSFTINHLTLQPGVYVSRVDLTPAGEEITTFDVRMTAPNREPALSISALHTIEHLAATYLRNDEEWKSRVIYWGPMGCCTGNYLILQGRLCSDDIMPLLRRTFQFISEFDGHVPGATPRDCGNYLLMNLPEARIVASRYLKILQDNDCPKSYPK